MSEKFTNDLPAYVIINDPESSQKEILRQRAQPMIFPLSKSDQKIIQHLEAKFDAEISISGLAAPQIGYNRRAIIFAVIGTPEVKNFRMDLTDEMPKTIWINPTYEPVNNEKHWDYEACFSVRDLAGEVECFKAIHYTAYTLDGEFIEGQAHGFLARVIQHEIDHLNGKLFTDYLDEGNLMSLNDYRQIRHEKMNPNLLESK